MAITSRPQRPAAAILAATVLTLPLGTIYAFSVFLKPIEAELGVTRSALSFVFGLATVGYMAGMNAAPFLYRVASPATLVGACGVVAALGIGLAAVATGYSTLLLGYSALFGTAGGAAYILLQQAATLMVRSRRGLLNGYVLALYPGGAMIGAPLFGWANGLFGYRATLGGLAAALLLAGFASAWLTHHAGSRLPEQQAAGGLAPEQRQRATLARLWMVFFLAAAAGLTVLSQAAGIITAYGGAAAMALAATTAITGTISGARISGGWLVDRFPVPIVATCAHGIALTGTIVLTLFPLPGVAIVALGLIGLGYGLISGCTAGGISVYWPPAAFGRIAGQVYLAWCVAAVTLPVLAGHLYDLTGGYGTTIIIAGCGNVLGMVIASGLPRRATQPAYAAS